jgi:hypothetical protein
MQNIKTHVVRMQQQKNFCVNFIAVLAESESLSVL